MALPGPGFGPTLHGLPAVWWAALAGTGLIRNEHPDLASASESGVGTGTATVPVDSFWSLHVPSARVLRA